MEDQDCQPNLCSNGCGFFSSSSLAGMCSKCFKSHQQQASTASPGLVPIPRATSRQKGLTEETQDGSREDSQAADSGSQVAAVNNVSQESGRGMNDVSDCSDMEKLPDSPTDLVVSDDSQNENLPNATVSKQGKRSRPSTNTTVPDAAEEADSRSSSKDSRPGSATSKKINRCKECNKRVGLTGYNCRCGEIFCGMHRYSDVHKCEFDYRTMGTEELRKNNPVVKGDKVQKL